MDKITLFGKNFQLYIPSQEISEIIHNIAFQINKKYANDQVIFLGILNGAFMFFSELMKQIKFDCEISFLKLASYKGTTSAGKTKTLVGINEKLEGKTVIIVEDIVETGITLEEIYNQIKQQNPAKIAVVSLFFKPDKYKKNIIIDLAGREIDNDFIVGFGLDYNGLGRNLNNIYKLV